MPIKLVCTCTCVPVVVVAVAVVVVVVAADVVVVAVVVVHGSGSRRRRLPQRIVNFTDPNITFYPFNCSCVDVNDNKLELELTI